MANNPNDIDLARSKRRDRTGWTLEEIKENAEKELKDFKKISKDEPSDLYSGDMDKIIRGEDDEDGKE
jgi:hypothetical protein